MAPGYPWSRTRSACRPRWCGTARPASWPRRPTNGRRPSAVSPRPGSAAHDGQAGRRRVETSFSVAFGAGRWLECCADSSRKRRREQRHATTGRGDAGGVRWQVHPKCHAQLIGPQGLRLDEWLRAGQAHVVKNGPHRTVYRVTLPVCPSISAYRLHDTAPGSRAGPPSKAAWSTTAPSQCRLPGADRQPPGSGERCEKPGPTTAS